MNVGGSRREVLHVQVASLLGVLVPHHVFLLFNFSLSLRKGWLRVPGKVLINLFPMHILDSSGGTLKPVKSVSSVFSETNKGKGSVLVGHHLQTNDLSVVRKDVSEVGLAVGGGEVLDIDVVEYFLEVLLFLLDVLDSLHGLVLTGALNGLQTSIHFLKGYEPVQVGLVVLVQRDLCTLYLSEL